MNDLCNSKMADTAYELWFFTGGEANPTQITVSATLTISELKEVVTER